MRPRLHRVPLVVAALLATVLNGGYETASAEPGNHRPGPPARLTVDGRVDPLAIDGVPHFGWLPRDRDRDEEQTAYQIVVTRGADRAPVWDSGRVASSSQSWVRYAGPALAPGTTYRWTVRTWDRRGTVSPYAAPASFDTGLGDGDWSGAAWMRRDTTGNDAANEWTLARTVLPVGPARVVRTRVYLSAMGDWALHVGGREVGRGSSYGYPGEGYYDVLAPTGVRAGEPLAIGVRYHYWRCRCQGRANGPLPPEGPSGLLVKVVVEHADGSADVAVSNGTWRVTRDSAQDVSTITFRNSDSGDVVERYDAAREITGWDRPGFDDSAWSPPAVIGPHPRPSPASCAGYDGSSAPCTVTHLAAQQAHLSRREIHPVSVLRLPDGTVFADMGRVVSAVPRIGFRSGVAGRAVTITTSYRRANTTLAAPTPAGARTATLASVSTVHPGDEITIDAPASGFSPGDPETRTVAAIGPEGTVELSAPLDRAHGAGAWVESSRAGTAGLDTQGSDMRFHYTQKPGAQVAEPFTYWAWRYLEISDPGEPLSAESISAVAQATDVRPAEAATFRSSDPTLDAVFRLMRHSALQSAQNVFLDTPTREKGQFLGDTIDISFATMESLGERSLTRQAIVEFIGSQSRYWPSGALNAVYPNGDGRRDIPDYTEMFPEWVMRYHHLTGDTDLVVRALPAMRRVADYILSAVDPATGLVRDLPGGSGPYLHGIIDWPPAMRYDTTITDNGTRTVVNALAVGALRAVSEAARIAGDDASFGLYRNRADALAAALRSRLADPATGRFADGLASSTGQPIPHFSQHAQSFPLAYGIVPPADRAALGTYLGELGMRQGPMTLRQLLAALRASGHPETILRLLTDPTADGPARVLAEGGTFLWEQWTPGCTLAGCRGAEINQSSSESFSHGWGAAGISGIIQSLLGLDVTGPGAATIQIAPPAIGLRHARGTVWTERGPVTVAWTRTGNDFHLDVTIPVNVTATVIVPSGKGSVVHTVGSGHTRLRG
ncbi:MAG TPA: alpha-L-rhamnosidase C-terminal domain-containing protein [Actinophytocola sp.]|uniref:alpha-L-rhamnosidase-related protein n=1 Tax=Actinophytocola sp. TaxID=1872138 RepID=UPI002DDCC503|nr:alpha-L-rhamnosidase C-terminal domain-containing protein [Actinophytocola sp.]HEV2783033.1 alpha-L-rhamnosidase C-terminal domain-containing protein [Actinophytocola sp.]